MIKKVSLSKAPNTVFKSFEYHEPVAIALTKEGQALGENLDEKDIATAASTPSHIYNARGNVTLPLESPLLGGDLNRQRSTQPNNMEHIQTRPSTVCLSPEQQHALEYFIQGQNIFITGPGGTGKTHLIKEFLRHASIIEKKIQVCALTGCASVLLGSIARTIHSWSGIKLAKGPIEKIIQSVLKNRCTMKEWRSVQILIIDEVSMMSLKIFRLLNELGKIIRKNPRPFGGIQLVFSGDFYQLGPIGDNLDPETAQFCFEHPDWFQIFPKQNHVMLKTIFRQNDPTYIEILAEVRQGNISDKNIEILQGYIKREYKEEDHNNCVLTKLFPVRSKADYINKIMFEKIEEPLETFTMAVNRNCTLYIDTGKAIDPLVLEKCHRMSFAEKEFELEQLIHNNTLPQKLELKKGSAVMCTANIDMENGICNGSQGMIVDFIGETRLPKVKFTNGIEKVIGCHYIQCDEYPCLTIAQYPLCLAWALTIHKIQGATLDMAQIDIGQAIFEYGQTYVALSRIKSLEGLYLSSFYPHRIKANPKVTEFYHSVDQ